MMYLIMKDWTINSLILHSGNSEGDASNHPLPGVTFLSDLLKVIDVKRQTGYTDEDVSRSLSGTSTIHAGLILYTLGLIFARILSFLARLRFLNPTPMYPMSTYHLMASPSPNTGCIRNAVPRFLARMVKNLARADSCKFNYSWHFEKTADVFSTCMWCSERALDEYRAQGFDGVPDRLPRTVRTSQKPQMYISSCSLVITAVNFVVG